MDVKNFYPSIDVNVAAEEIKLEVMESEADVNGVNYEEAALFLACTMTQDELDGEGLTHVVHRRRTKNGRRPGVTCKAISEGPVGREKDKSWLPPSRRPLCRQKRKMIACVLKQVVKLVMENHFYSYNNQIYHQQAGAGIGNQASEKIGRLLLKRFDRKFLAKTGKLKVELDLYKRYVDDVTAVLASLDPGVRYKDGKMVKKQELVAQDEVVGADKRTLDELVKVADSIYECINFTADCPSSQEGEEKKVPVLDLKLYIGDQGTILHEFYEKPVSCKLVIPANSAHSKRMKVAVMVEEGVRRLRNHSRGLDWQVSVKCMTKWARKLRRSGYPETFRHQVVTAAVGRWKRMCREEDEDIRPIHRPRSWRRRDRRVAKEAKRSAWHKVEGKVSAPLILDPVPGNMVDRMREEVAKFEKVHGIHVPIIQRAGKSVRSDVKPEPLRKAGCGRLECLVCRSGDKQGDCQKNSVTYKITCETCRLAGKQTSYEGETGRNAFARGLEHQQGLRQRSENSPLWKHVVLEHSSKEAEWSMEVIKCHPSSLGRPVHEAVRISRTEAQIILNSKSEFHQAPLIRVVATSGLQEEQSLASIQGVGAAARTRPHGRRGGGRGRVRARGGM